MIEAEYMLQVRQLYTWGAALFRQAQTETEVRKAICGYFGRGAQENFTTGELIDFLGVSSPCVLSAAGYDEGRQDIVMAMVTEVTDDEIVSAWAREAERRLAELESGAVVAIPVEGAIARGRGAK